MAGRDRRDRRHVQPRGRRRLHAAVASSSPCSAGSATCTARWSAGSCSASSRPGAGSTCPGTLDQRARLPRARPGAHRPARRAWSAGRTTPRGWRCDEHCSGEPPPRRPPAAPGRRRRWRRWRSPGPRWPRCWLAACSACRPSSTRPGAHGQPAIFMFVALAQAWNLIGGFAGYAGFGQVVFFGLGGYTTAVLMAHGAASSFWVALPVRGGRRRGVRRADRAARCCGSRATTSRSPRSAWPRACARSSSTSPDLTGGGAGITIPTVGDRRDHAVPRQRRLLLLLPALAALVAAGGRAGLAQPLRLRAAGDQPGRGRRRGDGHQHHPGRRSPPSRCPASSRRWPARPTPSSR